MTTIVSQSAFPVQGFEHRFYGGVPYHCVSAKLSLRWRSDGSLKPLLRQPGFVLNDVWRQQPYRSPLDYPSDLIPFKPTTDLLLFGTARPEHGRPATSWGGALVCPGVEKKLRFHGPRQWRHSLVHGWRLSEAEPTDGVRLCSDHAYGGTVGEPKDHYAEGEFYPPNPYGRGYIGRSRPGSDQVIPAPLVEAWDGAVGSLGVDVPVGQVGPMPGFVPERARFAGTYDAAWRRDVEPNIPHDFDLRYWNTAPMDQRPPTYLRSGDRIDLIGFTPEGHLSLALPDVNAFLVRDFADGSTASVAMALDTVAIDLDRARLTLRYHQIVRYENTIEQIRVYCTPHLMSARS